MSVLSELVTKSIKDGGLEGFSFTMPVISKKWLNTGAATVSEITFDQDTLTLRTSGTNWIAPFSARCEYVNNSDKKIPVTLTKADGSSVNESGVLFTLFPQQLLRLKRLFAKKLEPDNAHNWRKATGIPIRQVPRYLFLANSTVTNSFTNGTIKSGDDTGLDGTLYFFDENGLLIHPLFLASAFTTLLTAYTALNRDSSFPDQLSNIATLATDSATVRLINADGTPYTDGHINGITLVSGSGIALHTLNSYSGTDTAIQGELTRDADTGTTGTFPSLQAQQLLFSLATYGRMGNKVQLAKLPSGTTLHHDFFTVKVLTLKQYLTGTPNAAYNGTKLEPAPFIRLNEQVTLLNNGNDIIGQIQSVFSGTTTDSLCVGTALQPAFPLPANTSATQWPAFPALGSGLTADTAAFPADFKKQLQDNAVAKFITPASGPTTDIQLTLTGVPIGAAIRVYNRVFEADAVIKRGDGAGGVVDTTVAAATGRTFNGQCIIELKDPLGLKRPDGTTTVPASDARLIVDIMINQRDASPKKRLCGAITIPITTPAVAATPPVPDNITATAAKRGVSNAAILGLDTRGLTAIDFSSAANTLNTILQLTGETNPRDASRLPTMARRDLLCAASKTGGWDALIGGGRIAKEMHSAKADLGAPGTMGGKETQYTAVATQSNRLAYDIARMAFRRTTSIYDRIQQLADTAWNEPAAQTALGETDSPSGGRGNIHGAVLQTISPFCETPELALLKSVVESNIDDIPADWNALVDKVVTWINGIDTTGLPSLLGTAANSLRTELVNRLNSLKDTNPANEARNERLYNELKRELSASCFGRRDTQWALKQAIAQARHFIYIESPGISFTQNGTADNYTADLFADLTARLNANPGLRVILCVPKLPDYHRSYDQWIRSEVKSRFTLLQGLPAQQVVCFHPIGFPGRPANIESHVVIVDDCWMLLGSSAFRRRGLTFDGSSDIVFTDGELLNGKSELIKSFRRTLLSQRLNVDMTNMSDARPVLLEDARTSFDLIRQMLISGGLGRIERAWNGRTEGVTYADPTINTDLANPEGVTFNSLEAIIVAGFASLPK